jgi:hypothetical protein
MTNMENPTSDLVKELREAVYYPFLCRRAADHIEALEEKLDRAKAAMVECCLEIDDYVQEVYRHDHPVQERYRQRGFASNPARIALEEIWND